MWELRRRGIRVSIGEEMSLGEYREKGSEDPRPNPNPSAESGRLMAETKDEDGEEKFLILDFDMLCATVALQTRGISVETKRRKEDDDGDDDEVVGGVLRMWEGDVLDCLADRRIAIEAACCPCYRFGKNMRRANLGPCFLQGTTYFILTTIVVVNFMAFAITKRHHFLYVGVASVIAVGVYLGYFRTRIRKQFNIRGRDSYVDDCASHLVCTCCSLCQESRTLEMNNVQDGVWHGRGDTICIGSNAASSGPHDLTRSPALCSMERASDHSWGPHISHSEPLVVPP